MPISPIQKLKQEFLEYIEIERGRSLKTVANYDRYLARFFTQSKISKPKDITEKKIREFRMWLNRQPGAQAKLGSNHAKRGQISGKDTMKRRTQNYYLISIRSFLKFLAKRGIDALPPERIDEYLQSIKYVTKERIIITTPRRKVPEWHFNGGTHLYEYDAAEFTDVLFRNFEGAEITAVMLNEVRLPNGQVGTDLVTDLYWNQFQPGIFGCFFAVIEL